MSVMLGGGTNLLRRPESPATRDRRAPLRQRCQAGMRRRQARWDKRLLAALARFQTREEIEEVLAPEIDRGEYGVIVLDRWDTSDDSVVGSERRRIELLTDGDYTLLMPDQSIVLGVNMATVMPEAKTIVFNTSNQYRYSGSLAARVAVMADRLEEVYYAPGQPGSLGAGESFEEQRSLKL